MNIQMHKEALIEQVQWCTWRQGSSALRDTLRSRKSASVQMRCATAIEGTQRYTRRLRFSKFEDSDAGQDSGRLEAYLEVVNLERPTIAADMLFFV